MDIVEVFCQHWGEIPYPPVNAPAILPYPADTMAAMMGEFYFRTEHHHLSLDKSWPNAIIKTSRNAVNGVEGISSQWEVSRERPLWWKGCIPKIDEDRS